MDNKQLIEQLGGSKFVGMTGAHSFVTGTNSLSFRFQGSKRTNHLTIKYDETADLYILDFGKLRGCEYTIVKSFNGIYADSLGDIFKAVTGLATSL